MVTSFGRRALLRWTTATGGAALAYQALGGWGRAYAVPAAAGLLDPADQRLFTNPAPNALSAAFRMRPQRVGTLDRYDVSTRQVQHRAGIVNAAGRPLTTSIYAYGDAAGHSWPGRTIVARKGRPTQVTWRNALPLGREHLLPVDTTVHWAYGRQGYRQRMIKKDGVPLVTHLHGGHSRSDWDGNPEYFFSPGFKVKGPGWPGQNYVYANDQRAGALWYHDHVLGMTRLNVYAGLAGFYFIRDGHDTGTQDNAHGLPAGPYEFAYCLQDRMFRSNGALFYPAFPGDPAWVDFITDQGLSDDAVPRPSVMAEFFGDVMTVNGVAWPVSQVEPRHYRLRLLNGCDSRFLSLQLRSVGIDQRTLDGAGAPIPFWIVGSDQGLGPFMQTDRVLLGPGERMDLVVDFSAFKGRRVVLANTAADAPLRGDPDGDPADFFPDRHTDRVMAFDVVLRRDRTIRDRFDPSSGPNFAGVGGTVQKVRRLALFEGRDQYGRLQPVLGTAEPTKDVTGVLRNGAMTWHEPVTENPKLNSTEIWEIYNNTEDAHAIHLHQVYFEVLAPRAFTADVVDQHLTHHDGSHGVGARMENIVDGYEVGAPAGVYQRAPKDTATVFPGQVARFKMHWDLPGPYVWHCHLLSHEDHTMMRPIQVGK